MNTPFLLLLLLSTPSLIAHPCAQLAAITRLSRAPEHGHTFVSLDERTANAISALVSSDCAQDLACQESLAYLADACQPDSVMRADELAHALDEVLSCLEQKSIDDITGDLRDYKESLELGTAVSSHATRRRPLERVRYLEVDELRVYTNALVNGNTTLVTSNPLIDALDVNGNATFNGLSTFDGNAIVNGNLTITGTLTTESAVTNQTIGNITVNGNILLADTNANGTAGVLEISGVPFLHEGNPVAGSCVTFLGANAGNFTSTGVANTGIGGIALRNLTTGASNTALGCSSLSNDTTGSLNTAVGVSSLFALITGSSNTAIGANAGSGYTGNESNNIILGSNIPGTAGENGVIRIGLEGTQTSAFMAGIFGSATASGIPVLVNSFGQLGTTTSSRRFKEQIVPIDDATVQALFTLEPVAFCYKSDTTQKKQFGLVAEQVHEVLPELVVYDQDNKPYSVAYHVMPAMLLALVQQQQQKITAQEKSIEQQQNTIESLLIEQKELGKKVAALEKRRR